jgi:hypothetical protein
MVGRIPAAGEFQDHVLDKFKGFRQSGPSSLTDETFLAMAKNVIIGKNGELIKRPGAITYGIGANANVMPVGIYSIPITSASYKNDLIGLSLNPAGGVNNNKVYKSVDSGQTFAAISSATAHAYQAPHQYQGALYGVSDAGIWKWDGTTFTDYINAAQYPTTLYRTALIAFRMFVVNATGSIQYSAPADFTSITTWTSGGGGGIQSLPGDGQSIVGIIPFRDNLIIFRTQSIYVLQMAGALSPSSWSLRELSFQIGCTAERAMCVYKDVLFFTSQSGVYATDLITLNRISDPIDKAFNGRPATGSIFNSGGGGIGSASNAYVSIAADSMAIYNNKLFCIVVANGLNAIQHMEDAGISQATLNSTLVKLEQNIPVIYVYDLIQKVWTEFDFQLTLPVNLNPIDPALGPETWRIQPDIMYVVPASLGTTGGQFLNEGIYFKWSNGASTFVNKLIHYSENTHVRDLALEASPYMHNRYLPYTDPSGNYSTIVRTKNLDFDMPNQLKRCPIVSIGLNSGEVHNTQAVNTSINCNYYIDDILTASTTAPINSVQNKATKIRGPGFFRKVQIELVDTSNGYLEILNIIPSVRAKRKLTETRT